MIRIFDTRSTSPPRTRLSAVIALSALLAATAFIGSANANEHRDNHRDRGHHGDHRGGYWGGGYYAPPPVVYGSPYYGAPPVVYGPSVGIVVPGINIRLR